MFVLLDFSADLNESDKEMNNFIVRLKWNFVLKPHYQYRMLSLYREFSNTFRFRIFLTTTMNHKEMNNFIVRLKWSFLTKPQYKYLLFFMSHRFLHLHTHQFHETKPNQTKPKLKSQTHESRPSPNSPNQPQTTPTHYLSSTKPR